MLTLARVVSGVIFVIFGAGKFINHGSELSSFQSYGLPLPSTFVDVIGVLELAGGLLLILGLYTRPAALLLAGDMIGAIVVSGIGHGETISITLAPELLVATATLVLLGPGRIAADVRLHRARESAAETPAAGPGLRPGGPLSSALVGEVIGSKHT